MKSLLLRPWVSGIVLLAAISAMALTWVGAQSTPPPAPPKEALPAAPKVESKGVATDAVAEPSPSWGVTASASAYYTEKMKRIIFPLVRFKDSTMDEVVDFLRIKSRDLDTYEGDPAKKGVNLILKPNPGATPTSISLDLKDVPMAEVLKYVMEVGGMKYQYKIEAYAVIVGPFSEWYTEMYTRVFRVPPDFFTSTEGGPNQTALDFLKAKGIPFPEGASASFAPGTSRLTVRNTKKGLDMLEMMIEALQGHLPVADWAGARYYAEKLSKITIPSVQFRGATLEEAVEHLQGMGRDYDTFEKDPDKKGFNMVLRPDAATNTASINLDLKDVPMSEALKYLTELAGMKYKLEPYAVVILSQSDWATEMYTHIFRVPPDFLTSFGGGPEAAAKDVLMTQGVQFPQGGSASLLSDPSLLMVRNTIQGMYEVEGVVWNSMQRSASVSKTKSAAPGANERVNTASVTSVKVEQPAAATPAQMIEVRGGTLQEVGSGGGLFFITDKSQPEGSVLSSSLPGASGRAQQLLRDTELKVLLRHFETTVAEIIEAEKSLALESDEGKRSALGFRITGLKNWKSRVEASIHEFDGKSLQTSNATGHVMDHDPFAPDTRRNSLQVAINPNAPVKSPEANGKLPVLGDIPIIGRMFDVAPGEKPQRDPDGSYPLLLSSMKAGAVTEITPKSIRRWGDVEKGEFQGRPCWNITVAYSTPTQFGKFDTEAIAKVVDGRVAGWFYNGTGEKVP